METCVADGGVPVRRRRAMNSIPIEDGNSNGMRGRGPFSRNTGDVIPVELIIITSTTMVGPVASSIVMSSSILPRFAADQLAASWPAAAGAEQDATVRGR